MTKKEVLELLEKNQDARGIAHWQRGGHPRIQCFGIGLTKLKKLAKEVGRDHQLALSLWKTPVWDARLMAGLGDRAQDRQDRGRLRRRLLGGGGLRQAPDGRPGPAEPEMTRG